MTDLRRLHQCRHDGCDSEAKWALGLHLECQGVGFNRITLQCPTTIQVCEAHTKAATEFLLSARNRENISMGLLREGIPLPDWSSAVAVFAPIQEAPALDPAIEGGADATMH